MTTNINPAALAGITGIAHRLVLDGFIQEPDARKWIAESQQAKKSFYAFVNERKLVPKAALAAANAVEFGHSLLDLRAFQFDPDVIKLVKEELIQRDRVVPLCRKEKRLFVAISDPTNTAAIDQVKFQTGLSVEIVIADEDDVSWAVEVEIPKLVGGGGFDVGDDLDLDIEQEKDDDDEEQVAAVSLDEKEEGPIVKFVKNVLLDSIRRGVSDIHFEPYETEYRVRFRLDGMLKTITKAPVKLAPRIAARLKVMSGLDIAEKRLPQDGRIKLNISKTKQMDFRVSTCPTMFGEKVVLRMLDGGAAKLGIDKLGYEPEQKELYLKALSNPYGMILVTGPTGSGKTVSLYTGLNILNTEERNISTAEDPVEIRVPGINQVQMNPKKGMTFAAALRSFLRQDPDVVMVGEIRDLETAEIAVKAAQTGHLVLSTLHTNDAPQTISRLMNMGIAPYNITSSVTLIIAQRLARRLCSHCKKPSTLPKNALLQAGFTEAEVNDPSFKIYDAVGCSECNDGYKGRVGVYQVMPMLDEIQRIILDGGNAMDIAEVSKKVGIADLRQSALNKVKQGFTSLIEADRVTKS